ncbi:RHS repeat domain-containing protein [Candidatus Fukatsuia symbiotica]|uniref:RHS repeat domain-containing protein n=1 Tax=Candidatus Fukatsuia symbiotica TaxID=1878942 RepID=UPI000E76F5E7|nr:hypothetical protein [Candidatus Fukatsuia symbiotica]
MTSMDVVPLAKKNRSSLLVVHCEKSIIDRLECHHKVISNCKHGSLCRLRFLYNDDGRLIRLCEIEYNANDQQLFISEYKYDVNGRVVSRRQSQYHVNRQLTDLQYSADDLLLIKEYQYDANNRLVSSSEIKREYHANGQFISSCDIVKEYDAGQLLSHREFERDANGQLIGYSVVKNKYDADGQLIGYSKSQHGAHYQLLSYSEHDANSQSIPRSEYNSNNQLMEAVHNWVNIENITVTTAIAGVSFLLPALSTVMTGVSTMAVAKPFWRS